MENTMGKFRNTDAAWLCSLPRSVDSCSVPCTFSPSTEEWLGSSSCARACPSSQLSMAAVIVPWYGLKIPVALASRCEGDRPQLPGIAMPSTLSGMELGSSNVRLQSISSLL